MRYNSVLLSVVTQKLRDNIATSFVTLTAAVYVQKSEMNSQFDWFITWHT